MRTSPLQGTAVGTQPLQPLPREIRLEVFQDRPRHGQRFGVAASTPPVVFLVRLGPAAVDGRLNLHQLRCLDLFPRRKIELAGVDAVGLLGIVERDAVLAADERAVGVDETRAVLERRAGEAQAGRRQAAPGVGDAAACEEFLARGNVLAGALLDTRANLGRELLHGARNVGRLDFGDLEHLATAVRAALAAVDLLAVELLVAGELRLPLGGDFVVSGVGRRSLGHGRAQGAGRGRPTLRSASSRAFYHRPRLGRRLTRLPWLSGASMA